MALGGYLVSRKYGARPWMATLAGVMLPLSGFTLWMDGAAWVTGLTVTALTPWVWYTAKRAAEGRGSLLWAILAGYLCAAAGDPYGLVSTAIVFAAVLVEALPFTPPHAPGARPGDRRRGGRAAVDRDVPAVRPHVVGQLPRRFHDGQRRVPRRGTSPTCWA